MSNGWQSGESGRDSQVPGTPVTWRSLSSIEPGQVIRNQRRAAVKHLTFEDHMNVARTAGFRTEAAGGGKTRVERNGIAAIAEPGEGDIPQFTVRAGVMMGPEIGTLTDGGFQKVFTTAGGKRKPALAEDLKAIQTFQEDLREALDLKSLYNESLGTVSNLYLYDRVEGRDRGDHSKPWQTTRG